MSLTTNKAAAPPPTRRERLKRFLDAYWLRPENALWMALRSEALARCPFASPSADLCCGDGIFSFLHHGGVLDPAFDVFCAVRSLEGSPAGTDMFDHFRDDYRPPILAAPGVRIDLGTDLKPSLLSKAARLNLYERLLQHDNNRPLSIASHAFQTIYCNSAYWVTEIDDFLKDLRRWCAPKGRVILQVKLDTFRRIGLENCRNALGNRFLDLLVGQRLDSWKTLADRSTWEARFVRAGFHIEEAVPFVTETHARIWEIGLRPIAPLLIRMTDRLTPQTRADIKRDWVSLFLDLTEPFCDPGFTLSARGGEPVEVQYILTGR